MRKRKANNYRKGGLLYDIEATNSLHIAGQNTEVVTFSEIGVPFKCKDSNGQGLNKTQYSLFSNWIMQAGNYSIETDDDMSFDKGKRIELWDGTSGLIENVLVIHTNENNNRRRTKRSHNQVKVILFG